ncbi:Conserved_hypothetical protein [Hexamita inflata]|uniref:Uncharacterized protein n=1 Tax=Hexamita inflata TaxID=28002 RepID=A0AA86PWY9_9EUKA|nr:Conserved hypothetical protein [Hexamita inflata]
MKFKADDTDFIIQNESNTKVIHTYDIHQNKLYDTPTKVFFRSIEEYYSQSYKELVQYNLIAYDKKTEKINMVMRDMPFFDLMFVHNNVLTGLKIDLLYGYQNNRFEPLGAIEITKPLLLSLMYNDSSLVPQTLMKPTKFSFEYTYQEETFTYLENWMITSVNNQVIHVQEINFNVNGLNLKYIQIKDSIYGFIGDYLLTKTFCQLTKGNMRIIQAFPHFQYEISSLVEIKDQCGILQPVSDEVNIKRDWQGELRQVVDPNSAFALFIDGQFIELQGNLSPSKCVYNYSDQIKFYTHHAVLFDDNNNVKSITMLPLHLDKQRKLMKIDGATIANIEGEEINLGFLNGFVG